MIQMKEQLQELIDKVDKKIEIKIKEIEKQAFKNIKLVKRILAVHLDMAMMI